MPVKRIERHSDAKIKNNTRFVSITQQHTIMKTTKLKVENIIIFQQASGTTKGPYYYIFQQRVTKLYLSN